MTTKSQSKRSSFFRNRSTYFSGLAFKFGQNVVSKSLIFKLPQTLRRSQSWKQSLCHLDGIKSRKKKHQQNTQGHMWIGEPTMIVIQSFQIGKRETSEIAFLESYRFRNWSYAVSNMSTISNKRFIGYAPFRRSVRPKNSRIGGAKRWPTVNPTWLWKI